jgi:hypothetical protein
LVWHALVRQDPHKAHQTSDKARMPWIKTRKTEKYSQTHTLHQGQRPVLQVGMSQLPSPAGRKLGLFEPGPVAGAVAGAVRGTSGICVSNPFFSVLTSHV